MAGTVWDDVLARVETKVNVARVQAYMLALTLRSTTVALEPAPPMPGRAQVEPPKSDARAPTKPIDGSERKTAAYVVGGAGVLTLALGRGAGWGADDAGVLATARTAILSGLAVLAAWLHRPGAFSSLGPLAYPLLAAIGLKLAFADLRESTAATLFIALACYGAALVLVPRIRRVS